MCVYLSVFSQGVGVCGDDRVVISPSDISTDTGRLTMAANCASGEPDLAIITFFSEIAKYFECCA